MSESRRSRAVAHFAALVSRPDAEIDLAEAALAIAAGAQPDLNPAVWLAELDRMADGVNDLDSLRRRLFEELGFTGNTKTYAEPENSFLNLVIERRTGIPISLSVLMMEVGRRAGVELQGIGMPGHFLVRDTGSGTYVDAFHGGALLDEKGCEALFRAATGAAPERPFGPELLAPVTTRHILARMLGNLRGLYHALGRPVDLEWVLRMRLALPGAGPSELVELGEALALQGRFREGAGELETRAEATPDQAPVLNAVARALRARLN